MSVKSTQRGCAAEQASNYVHEHPRVQVTGNGQVQVVRESSQKPR